MLTFVSHLIVKPSQFGSASCEQESPSVARKRRDAEIILMRWRDTLEKHVLKNENRTPFDTLLKCGTVKGQVMYEIVKTIGCNLRCFLVVRPCIDRESVAALYLKKQLTEFY